jgi:hypothetical protein
LAFSDLSCAISISISLVRCSISRTGRQLSIDKNERHGGSDAGDSPLLRERHASAGEGDVVIGGEQGDQSDEQARDGLQPAKPIEAWPGTRGIERFWRIRSKGLNARKLRMLLAALETAITILKQALL